MNKKMSGILEWLDLHGNSVFPNPDHLLRIITAPPLTINLPIVTQQQSISVRYVRKLADLEVGDTGTLREHGKNGLSYREAKFTKHDTSNGYFLFDNPNWIDTIIVPAHQAQNWEMVVESTVGEPESFGKPQPCLNHFWKEYQGLHEIWKNCIHCGVKYEDHIGGNAQPQEEEIDDEFIIF